MNKTTVYLPDDLKLALERTAHATGQSEASIIRDAIRQRVRPPRPRPGIVSSEAIRADDLDEAMRGFGER